MLRPPRFIDHLRRTSHPAASHLLDGLLKGTVDRRQFLRQGSILGLSAATMGGVLGSLGMAGLSRPARAEAAGGTLRLSHYAPASAIDPVTVADGPGLNLLHQVGDFLVFSNPDLTAQPMLATSWSPNEDGSVWTFTLRQDVRFHDGRPMTARDVAATINRLADPANGSNALSAFRGVLSAGAARAVDDHTVEFTLDAPNGNFPFLVSSDNYNTIILPEDYQGDFEATWPGTGPFRIERYRPKERASFARNPDYWGPKALPERIEITFYDDLQAQLLALQGDQTDVICQVTILDVAGLLNDPNYSVIDLPCTQHIQISMRTDMPKFADPRVRRAMALTLDRGAVVSNLLRGHATIGNDSPFSPLYPSTDKSVAQRQQDLAQARELLAAAGAEGLEATFTFVGYIEVPSYAAVLQSMAAEAGINLTLNGLDLGTYYGDAVFGNSPWLDSEMSGVDYGHRGVPNVFLSAPLLSDGTWNAAHYKNPEYDRRVAAYIAALTLEEQQQEAGAIQRILLEDTPVIFGYFSNYMALGRSNVSGVRATGMGQVFVNQATRA